MKKGLILILCLIFNFIGCTSTIDNSNPSSSTESKTKEVNNSTQSTDTNKSTKEKTDDNKNSSDSNKSKEASSNNGQTKNNNKTNTDANNTVSSKVKLYNGTYFDDKCFGENTLKNYCEIMISNIKDTSFDFTVYEVNISHDNKESKKVIFNTNTAYFTDDGTKAVFKGKDYTLNFSFPNNHNASPIVTDIEVSGFNRLENNTYVNNGIPGHEFG